MSDIVGMLWYLKETREDRFRAKERRVEQWNQNLNDPLRFKSGRERSSR